MMRINRSSMRPSNRPPLYISFVWLIYLIIPLYTIFQRPLEEMLFDLLVVVLFAVIYVFSFVNDRYRFVLVWMQFLIIGYFTLHYDPNFFFMGFYPAPVIAMMRTTWQMIVTWAGLLCLHVSVLWLYHFDFTDSDMLTVLPAMLVMLFMPLAFRLGRRSRELRQKLDLANEQIARMSANEERARISRDLHDTLGHSLSLITMKSELAEKLMVKNPERAAQEVRDIQSTSRAALRQVRELVQGLNMTSLAEEIIHAKQLLAAANISLRMIDVDNHEADASMPLINHIIGMCLRETVTNVVRHSQATTCTIECICSKDAFSLIVTDNGIGCDADQLSTPLGANGLKGMRERLKLVEGKMDMQAAVGGGTSVRFVVPLVTRTTEGGDTK
ncbi:integral membrane sensor signal transduction histidine kinase [Paenibacillus curdlanolyticus YK9]|uniref:histidine kinase n=1 Tax=Paenibacillus curdlanolyticus YK9 TaxID=717606 RepID=E0ICD5_9BACL|nr:sensor histidine kinase [Paenibacillus curdlanolyticus]EFM09821.1 integral membrane sensor signal transduction histidine kinase [Paenibacillus curdlanolyticus YK9]